MKKIIINGRFLLHKVTGVERYASEIIRELDSMVQKGSVILAIPPETEYVPQYKNISVRRVGRLHNIMWEHISFPAYVRKYKGISLNLCNVAPLISPGIVCIHDMKVKARPQYFSWKFLAWYNILFKNETKRARKIITVSEFSKSEIQKYYHVEENRIQVIPNGWQHYERIGYDEETLDKFNLKKEDYYFSICSVEPNKNLKWIAEVAKKNGTSKFVIAGSVNDSVFAEGIGFERPKNMILLGYVSDEEAKTLMRECKAFLFPTFYEGFGIPPLEAMSAGAQKIVVSDTKVMHEIFEDEVIYIDPYESTLVDNEKKMNRDKILNKYSWKKSALEMKDLIKREIDKNDI